MNQQGQAAQNRLIVAHPADRTQRDGAATSRFIAEVTRLGLRIRAGEPLARHTTFRIGGPAEMYAAAGQPDLLAAVLDLANAHEIPVTVLGGGSNVLVSDEGIRGLVIANQSRGIRAVTEAPVPAGNPPQVVVDSGVALAGLARWTIRAGWAGLEWAVSVPGTVGGAVIGNAGAHGGEIADHLAWAYLAYPGQSRRYLTLSELEYGYRSSSLKHDLARRAGHTVFAVLLAGFALQRGDPSALTTRADEFLAQRRSSQPVEPSAGSVFRNPPGDYAGRLIEAVDLKGYALGGAQISLRHANFIVNTGSARAADVLRLMKVMQERVQDRFGIRLIPEILFLGEPDAECEQLFSQ